MLACQASILSAKRSVPTLGQLGLPMPAASLSDVLLPDSIPCFSFGRTFEGKETDTASVPNIFRFSRKQPTADARLFRCERDLASHRVASRAMFELLAR